MPPTYTDEGTLAARTIKDRHPSIGVLVLSQHIEAAHVVDLVGRPGFGYLLKDRVLEVEEFLATAARVAAGGSGERTVEAHVRHLLIKLDIPESDEGNRRVLAVLTHLRTVHKWT